MNMKKDRIAEGEINMAFKEQEVAKFRANCKRAFQKRIDLYMAEEDKGEAKMSEIRRQKNFEAEKGYGHQPFLRFRLPR